MIPPELGGLAADISTNRLVLLFFRLRFQYWNACRESACFWQMITWVSPLSCQALICRRHCSRRSAPLWVSLFFARSMQHSMSHLRAAYQVGLN